MCRAAAGPDCPHPRRLAGLPGGRQAAAAGGRQPLGCRRGEPTLPPTPHEARPVVVVPLASARARKVNAVSRCAAGRVVTKYPPLTSVPVYWRGSICRGNSEGSRRTVFGVDQWRLETPSAQVVGHRWTAGADSGVDALDETSWACMPSERPTTSRYTGRWTW
jgi:hypothetical protein